MAQKLNQTHHSTQTSQQNNQSQTKLSIMQNLFTHNTKKPEKSHSSENKNWVQDFIEIKEIIGGMVVMTNGSVVGIQEIIPLNFYQRTPEEQNEIIESFDGFFRAAPNFLHFKLRTEKTDVNKLIANINNFNKDEIEPKYLAQVERYIKHIKSLHKADSVHRRYLVIWEYEGDSSGKKSNDINEIYRSMEQTRNYIVNAFNSIGNPVITPPDINWHVCELLYGFFNPKSSVDEMFFDRVGRLVADEKRYNQSLHTNKYKYNTTDYISPRGLTKRLNHIILDGQYQTFLLLQDKGHPNQVYGGWTDCLSKGLGYDVDILIQKKNRAIVTTALDYNNRFSEVYANEKMGDRSKFNDIMSSLANKTYIQDMMKQNDDDLWDVLIIITIRANSYKELLFKKDELVRDLQKNGILTIDTFQNALECFKMTMPLNYINRGLFNKNCRNYLTSSLPSLYNMTSNEMFDNEGLMIGTTNSGALLSINQFNTAIYENANISIYGTSGAGKTFLEEMLAYRARMTGMRTFFVLPVKGHEYEELIHALNGSFIRLHPGAEECINLMQIRPTLKIFKDEDEVNKKEVSLLSKKATSIIAFLSCLLEGEPFNKKTIARLNSVITDVYRRIGITDDNDSIYRDENKTVLKIMPTIAHLQAALKRDPELEYVADLLDPFVNGTYSNFNGQTNVDLTNKCIAIDVDERVIGKEYLPAIMYLATDFFNDLIMQDDLSKDLLVLDELWKMMSNDNCAKQIQEIVKLIRGYGGSLVIATQEITDCVNSLKLYGKSIITNSAIKILLKLNKPELNILMDYIDISPAEYKRIPKLSRGHGFIYSNADKIAANFIASEYEEEIFTTDINRKKALRDKRIAKKRKNA